MSQLPNIWSAHTLEYRADAVIAEALSSAEKKGLQADLSIIKEMSRSFPFLRSEDQKIQAIRGPADLQVALAVSVELQALKDRAAEVILTHSNMLSRLERLKDIVSSMVHMKEDVMALKNANQRSAVVSLTCPELDDKISRVRRVLDSATLVSKNTNQSYNILKLQIDIIKEMMYEAGLARASTGKNDRS